MLTAETKLLAYKDVREDDRLLTILKQNYTGNIIVYYPHIVYEANNDKELEMLEQCSESFFKEENNRGIGKTITEALNDYISFLNGKTVCFRSDYDESYYLVSFDFDNIYNFDEEYSDIDGEIENFEYGVPFN